MSLREGNHILVAQVQRLPSPDTVGPEKRPNQDPQEARSESQTNDEPSDTAVCHPLAALGMLRNGGARHPAAVGNHIGEEWVEFQFVISAGAPKQNSSIRI